MAALKLRTPNRIWQMGTYKVGSPNYVTVNGALDDPSDGFLTFEGARVAEASDGDAWSDGDYFGVLLYVSEIKYKIWTASWDGTSSPKRLLLVEEEYTIGSWGDGDVAELRCMPTKWLLREMIARPTFADPVAVTGAATLLQAWNGHIVEGSSGSPFSITLPEGITAMHVLLVQTGAGLVSVDPATNVTLNGATDTIALAGQYKSAYLYTKGSDDWVILT